MFNPFPDIAAIADAIKFFCYTGAAFFLASTAVVVIRFLRDLSEETLP